MRCVCEMCFKGKKERKKESEKKLVVASVAGATIGRVAKVLL